MTRLYHQHRARILLINIIFVSVMATVMIKLFYIQVINHETYAAQAERQGNRLDIMPAKRGDITDRNGKAMTSNVVNYSFAADPQVLTDPAFIAESMAAAFDRPAGDYFSKMQSDREFVWLERNVTRAKAASLLNLSRPGFIMKRQVHRRYPYGLVTRSLIGSTDVDNRGITGLEMIYDGILRGESDSRLLRLDARGRTLPRPGDLIRRTHQGAEIRLTIDIDYQAIFTEEMALAGKRLGAKSINGILIDPHTGDILAMAQYQQFDDEHPVKSRAAQMRAQAVTDMYEPGSTLKVVPAVAALESGLYTPTDSIDVESGEFIYRNMTIEDTHPKEVVTFAEVLAYSSNIGIIKIAENLGADELYRYNCNFGLGALTGLALPGETAGILRHVDDWSAISTGEIAMGQEVGVTSLQLAMLYGAIANGGLLLEPRLIMGVGRGRELNPPSRQKIIRRVASSGTMQKMRAILTDAVEIGTAHTAQIPGFELAGKTGTAQKFVDGAYSNTKFVSTFAAIFPANAPRLVAVVAVDEPVYGHHYGSQAAAPIVRNTLRRILNLDDDLYIPMPDAAVPIAPTNDPETAPKVASMLPITTENDGDIAYGIVPDFRGYSLRAALMLARKSGVDLRVTGSGRVTKQSLKPGLRLSGRTACLLTLVDRPIPS